MKIGLLYIVRQVPMSRLQQFCTSEACRQVSVAKPKGPLLLLLTWGLAVLSCTVALAIHESQWSPEASGPSVAFWPQARWSSGYTLLLFLHPKCPCSGATVEELNRLLTHCGGKLNVQAFVFQPRSQPQSWAQTALVQTLKRIPKVTVSFDIDAQLARRMGAIASGQVLLYDPAGHLQFSGGITPSRGHAGDNDGEEAVVAHVLNQDVPAARVSRTPVFGCALYPQISQGKQ